MVSKQFLSQYVACNPSYIRRCSTFFQSIEEYRTIGAIGAKRLLAHFFNAWEWGHVNLIFSPDLADGMN